MDFKKENNFEKRLDEAKRVMEKYKDRVPIIIEQSDAMKIRLDKIKYLVPIDLTIGQFIVVVRKRLKLKPENALFIGVNNMIPPSTTMMGDIYKRNVDKDKFLYLQIFEEQVFG